MESFYALNLDSIYAISSKTQSVTLYNRSGDKLNHHRLYNDIEISDASNYTSNVYVIFNNWVYKKGDKLYFPCIEQAPLSDPDRYKKSTLAQSFDINSGKVDFFYRYPDIYSKKNYGHLTLTQFRTMNSNGLFVYGFSADEYIYVTDYSGLNKKYFGGTTLFDPPTNLPEGESNTQSEIYQKNRMSSPYYRGILYDEYRDVYYRFAVGKGNEKAPLHQMRYYADISVIILDNNFKWIGETKLPKDTYSYKFWFVGKDGLYISKSHPFNQNISEFEMQFGVFLPQEISIDQ